MIFGAARKIARRELRGGLRGFFVFVLCLMLGVGSIAAVLSLASSLMESLQKDGRTILGGDIALRTLYAEATPEQVKFLHDKMGPITIVMETRAMARTLDESDAALVEVKAVDVFYPHYGRLVAVDAEGNEIPRKELQLKFLSPSIVNDRIGEKEGWGALVERELLERLELKIGDRIRIGDLVYTINGVVLKEPDRVGSLRYALAPRVMISKLSIDKAGLTQEGAQIYYDHKIYAPYIKDMVSLKEAVEKVRAAFPDANWRIRTLVDASPGLRRSIERLTTFLSLIGLSVLLIGGVGVANAVRAFLDEKLASMATMKCLGASSRLVFASYGLQIFLLTLAGVGLGLIAGAGVSVASAGVVAEALDLTPSLGLYPKALAVSAGFGFLTAACFALWPLGRAARVRPADLFRDVVAPAGRTPGARVGAAVAVTALLLMWLAFYAAPDRTFAVFFSIGAVIVFAVFWLCAAIARFAARKFQPFFPRLRLALANLYRPGNITGSTILSLGLGMTVLVAVLQIERNFSNLLSQDIGQKKPSFFFLDIRPDQEEDFRKAVMAHEGVSDLVLAPSLRGRILGVNGVEAEKALVDENERWVISSDRGFTYMRDMPRGSTLVEGEWWPADYNGPPALSISTDVARAFDIGVGDELTVLILGRTFTAKVMNVREVDWTSFAINFAVTFAPGVLESAPATSIGTLAVPPESEIAVQRDLARRFPNVTSVRVRDAMEAAQKLMAGVSAAIKAAAALTLVAGTLVLAGSIAASNRRRLYDAVILKVLGATRKKLFAGFLFEYAILGLVTAAAAGALGTAVAYGVQSYLMEDLRWGYSLAANLTVTVLCLLVTLGAGCFGIMRVLAKKPAPMLRNQ